MNILKVVVSTGVETPRDLNRSSMWSLYEAELATMLVWKFKMSLVSTVTPRFLLERTRLRLESLSVKAGVVMGLVEISCIMADV